MKEENKFAAATEDMGASAMYGRTANTIKEDKLADIGNEIHKYIQQLTQAKENVPPPAANIKPTASNGSSKM